MTGSSVWADDSSEINDKAPAWPRKFNAKVFARSAALRLENTRRRQPLPAPRLHERQNDRCARTPKSSAAQTPRPKLKRTLSAGRIGQIEQCLGLPSPQWYYRRQRTRPRLNASADCATFSVDTFHESLGASALKSRVRATLVEVLYHADEFGRTSVSGRRLAMTLGIREATVSSHLSKARDTGFLLTKYRYNNSPVQQLAWPGSGIHPPQPGVSPLTSRIWSDGELAWWTSLSTDWPLPPPWGVGEPPF